MMEKIVWKYHYSSISYQFLNSDSMLKSLHLVQHFETYM